jgi:hypothetical protein
MRAYDPNKAAQLHEEIHAHVPSEPALRVKALESLLVEKGLVNSGAIDAWLEIYRDHVGPKLGARVVARAWTDSAYKTRLLADGTAAIKELGIQGWAVGHLKVVKNTDRVHNLVVCTLCSARTGRKPRGLCSAGMGEGPLSPTRICAKAGRRSSEQKFSGAESSIWIKAMDFSKNAPRGEERGIHHMRSDEMSFCSALIVCAIKNQGRHAICEVFADA